MKNPKAEMSALWKQFYPMVWQRVRYYQKLYSYKLSEEELFESAQHWFVQAYYSFDETKASFSTHLFSKLRGIGDECRRVMKQRERYDDIDDFSTVVDESFTALNETKDTTAKFYEALSLVFDTVFIEKLKNATTEYQYKKAFKDKYAHKADVVMAQVSLIWQSVA